VPVVLAVSFAVCAPDVFFGRAIFSCVPDCDSAAVGNWLLYSTAMERSGMAMIGDRAELARLASCIRDATK
jgi:hypothetical protein